MKAARLHEFERPLVVDDVAEPDLQGPHDVIVKVGGAGLCRTDLHLIDGWFKEMIPAERPFTLGHENAGWVEAVGDAVATVKPGDTVIVHPLMSCGACAGCRQGEDMYCSDSVFPGVNADGGFAEYLRTTDRALVVLPSEIAPAEIAPHADAGLAAYRAARKAAALLGPQGTAVVIGVGGLGHIGIQVLRSLSSARIVAVDRSPLALDLARELDVDEAIGGEGAVDEILHLTGGAGADVVLDFVGEGDTPREAVAMLRQGGAYLVIGYGGVLNTPIVELILKEITIMGNLVGNHDDLQELMALVKRNRIKLTTHSYTLNNIQEAIDGLRNGAISGRAVIVPG